MTVIYLILGAIMDELPMLLMTVPIFLPIVLNLGFNSIWFGVYVVLVMEMGMIAPPVGLICFVLSGVAKDISLVTIYKGALPYIVTLFVVIVIITIFPSLTTWLPDIFYGPEMPSTLK
jgi:TRAP-type C4-dicarboxylate transport system permease large subunit